MDKTLREELKEAGFTGQATLNKLLDFTANTKEFFLQRQEGLGWRAANEVVTMFDGSDTPEEAIARLIVETHKKKTEVEDSQV